MRALLQRVSSASVAIEGEVHGQIEAGILILLGIEDADSQEDIDWLIRKILSLRIFEDADGKMNNAIGEADGDFLVISQFTLHARVKKGTRPSFDKAAKPDIAIPLYESFIRTLEAQYERQVSTGKFGADMKVSLVNDGPVTIWIDTKNRE